MVCSHRNFRHKNFSNNPPWKVMHVGNSCLVYDTNVHPCVNDFYMYIVDLIKSILDNPQLALNVDVGSIRYDFKNDKRTLRIAVNYEHTLVRENGRSVPPGTPHGCIKYDSSYYLVRIVNFEELNCKDIIIDYSLPNIHNVKASKLFDAFAAKHLYIAPSIFEKTYFQTSERSIQSLTTFVDTNQPRRTELLHKLPCEHRNVNNCFDKCELQKLYRQTKILINIHQTDHHNTFEELRVLPALQNGVIVVSENSPLKELVPYNGLIFWSDYGDIVSKANEVLLNYEDAHRNIFTPSNRDLILQMHKLNHEELRRIIHDLA